MKTTEIKTISGIAITEDNWIVYCPHCDKQSEYEGFFDSEDIYKCPSCKNKFIISEIVFIDGRMIE